MEPGVDANLKVLLPLFFQINNNVRQAEVHWYEAHGIGKKMKIKNFLD